VKVGRHCMFRIFSSRFGDRKHLVHCCLNHVAWMARKRTSRLLLDEEDDPLQAASAPTLFHTTPAPIVQAPVHNVPVADLATTVIPPRGSMVYGADDISYLVDGCADRQPLSVRLTSALALAQKFRAGDGSSARHLVRSSDGLAAVILSMMHSDDEALQYLGMLLLHGLCQLPAPPPAVADVLLSALTRDRPPPDTAATPASSADQDASNLISKRRRRQVHVFCDYRSCEGRFVFEVVITSIAACACVCVCVFLCVYVCLDYVSTLSQCCQLVRGKPLHPCIHWSPITILTCTRHNCRVVF
jgi:hypothetical protein